MSMARFAAAVAVGMAAGAPDAEAADPIAWRTDVQSALAEASQKGKLVLVNVHTEWCGPCRRLERTTLQDPGLARLIQSHCIPVTLDGDRNESLLARWKVRAFPTQVFLDPNGKVLDQLTGFVTAPQYAAALTKVVDRHRPTTKEAVASTPSPAPAPQQPKSNGEPPADRQQVLPCDHTVPLALGGYCPVTMVARAELVAGEENHCRVYQGQRYNFASEREESLFRANPDRYLPAERGQCVVTWQEQGRWTAGQIEFPAMFEDQLYLFADEGQRQKFLKDPQRYVDSQGGARPAGRGSQRGMGDGKSRPQGGR